MKSNNLKMNYNPSPTGIAFHESRAQVRCIAGPIGCLSPETMVMTLDGWVRIDEWNGQDILQWDSDSKESRFVQPKKYMVYPESTMYHFHGGCVDMVLSAEHKVPYYGNDEELKIIRADDLAKRLKTDQDDMLWIPIETVNNEILVEAISKRYTKVDKVTTSDGKMYCFETDTGFFTAKHNDKKFITGNSGKTVICVQQVNFEMQMMPADENGVRRSAWCFIRDTEANLRDTTMETWLDWFPEGLISKVTRSVGNMKIEVKYNLDDGTKVESIIHCKHQGKLGDIENLKSLELTGVFINEATNVLFAAVMMAFGRTGRSPKAKDINNQLYRVSMLMDTNMPDDMHWYYELAENKHPAGWEFFKQPPAMFSKMGPDKKLIYIPNRGQKIAQGIMPAENIENLGEKWNYYQKLISAYSDAWIRVFVMSEYGTITTGLPVYNEWCDDRNYVDREIPFDPSKTLFLCFDWGQDVCCAIMQMAYGGQVRMLEEVIPDERMGAERFWDTILKEKLVNDYNYGRGTQVFAVGDPAGGNKSDGDESSPISILSKKGLDVVQCHVMKPKHRIPCVVNFLTKTANKGEPAFIASSKCKVFRKGANGWYFFKRVEQHVDEVFSGEPCKNSFSHIQDAVQYGCHVFMYLDEYDVDFRATTDEFGQAVKGGLNQKKSLSNRAAM